MGSQPGPPDVSANDVYNALPYFKGIRIEYRTFTNAGAGSATLWQPVPQDTVSGLWNGKDFLPREIINCYLRGTPHSGTPRSFGIYKSESSLITVAPSFQQVIQFKSVLLWSMVRKLILTTRHMLNTVLPSATDPSWNWMYIPTDGSGIPLGNYGPAPNPLTLTLPSGSPDLLYYQFCLEGACDNPNSTDPIADTSFNTPFSISTIYYSPRVQYRYDISGQRDPSSLQVGGSFSQIFQYRTY